MGFTNQSHVVLENLAYFTTKKIPELKCDSEHFAASCKVRIDPATY